MFFAESGNRVRVACRGLERSKTHAVAAHGLCMQGIAVGAVVAELLETAHERCGNLALPSAVSPRAHLRRGRAAAVIGKSRIYGSIGVDLRTPFHKVGRFDNSHRLLPLRQASMWPPTCRRMDAA